MFLRVKRNGEQPSADEQVSVILKRRVPISDESPALSWLGGLPMMPRSVKWPRDAKRSPLHFLAQIHCGDLPADLWGGFGPRKGWLLLFAHVLKLEDEAKGRTVQVLHINELGPETEPPEETPTVRHVMCDYIAHATPEIRPGVPKLWRKWPLELVVQRYRLSETEWRTEGAPCVSGADLYGAPESGQSLHAQGSIALDRPLTWRGAFYVVEGLLRDLGPGDSAREFAGLKGPPEPDQTSFNAELQRRCDLHPAFAVLRQDAAHREPGWGIPLAAARDEITAQLKAERRSGWMDRCFTALEAEEAKFSASLADEERQLAAERATLGEDRLRYLEGNIQYRKQQLETYKAHRQHLAELFAPYSGPGGEEALNCEIERSAEAYPAWAEQQAKALRHWRDRILTQKLDSTLPVAEWDELFRAITSGRSAYWQSTYDTSVLRKVEYGLNFRPHLDRAIREDALDLYARGGEARSLLPTHIVDDLEQKLRHVESGRPHRVGGHPNPVQHENQADDPPLLFQLTSDEALGWGWGDLGALYVTIDQRDLRRGRFDEVDAWIEGG